MQESGSQHGTSLSANYAVYPYLEATSISSKGVISLTLPAVQEYAANGFAQGINTMVAVTSGSQDKFLSFKNLCGYLVVKLYGTGSVRSISLSGNNGEKIAGSASVTAVYGKEPETVMGQNATTSISVDCGRDGVDVGAAANKATEYWFCVPPTNFSKGFTVSITGTDGKIIEKKISSSVAVTRNVINSLESLKVDFNVISWEEVKTKSIFQNGLFGMFSNMNPKDYSSYLIYQVKVEKRSDANMFRVKNICKSSVCPLFNPSVDLDGDMYFNIDATNPQFVEVDNVGLKVVLNSSYGEQWAGTHCGAFSSIYEVGGTFDSGTGIIKWNPNQLQCWMPAYGTIEEGYFWDCYETVLWLDENNMGDDFTLDYNFEQYLPSTLHVSQAFDYEHNAEIRTGVPKDASKAASLAQKYGTVYCIPDYFVSDYDIFANINKYGKLALPDSYKNQSLGVNVSGIDAYMAIKDAEFSESKGALIMYSIVDENGNVLLADCTDYFYTNEIDDNATIDDYVGTYKCNVADKATVTVTKINETTLAISGITQYGDLNFTWQSEDGKQYYPSFVGGVINQSSNIYAYPGNVSASSFTTSNYNIFNYRRSVDGKMIPFISELGVSNNLGDILILQQGSGWMLKKAYNFTDLMLTPANSGNTISEATHKNGPGSALSFKGEQVKVHSTTNRLPQLAWNKK